MKKIIDFIKKDPFKYIFFIVGFLFIIIFFLSIILTHGDSVKHYLFSDQKDTFMDFFNSIYDTIGRHPYQNGVIYPPICYVIYYIFSRFIPIEIFSGSNKMMLKLNQGPMLSILIYLILEILFFILLCKKVKKGKEIEKNLFVFLMLLSVPFLFAFERGNIIFVLLILLIMFFAFKDSKNKVLKELSLISLACSAAIKIYPAIFGLVLIKEKKFKEINRVIIYGLILFFMPFIFFGGFGEVIQFYKNITGATASFNEDFIINKINFSTVADTIANLLSIPQNCINIIFKIFIILIFITSCINALISNSKWKTTALLCCLMIGIPGISFTYTAIFLVIPLIYFLDEKKEKSFINFIYLILFILILFPNPISLFEQGNFNYFYTNVSLNTKIMSFSIFILTLLLNIENFILCCNKNTIKKKEKKESRITYIDVTKAIALLFVVFGHLVKFNSDIFNWIFSFHMPLFFILSGMCCNFEKYNKFTTFAKKKLKTLIKPYFIFSFIGFIICLLVPDWRTNALSIEALKQFLYNSQPELLHVGQIWFLVALFFSNILFYILENILLKKANKLVKTIAYIILSIIGYKIFSLINIPYFGRLPWKIDVSITATVFIAIGYYINKFKLIERISNLKITYLFMLWLIFINIIFGTILNGYVNICNCDFGNFVYYYISAISGCILICMIGYKLKNLKFLCYYGKNSLQMFALHSFLLSLSEVVLSIIYNKQYLIMNNIPLNLCIITTIVIYLLLLPISLIYNFIKNKIDILFHGLASIKNKKKLIDN